METSVLEQLHAGLLAEIPEGVEHVTDDCPFCNPNIGKDLPQGGEMTKEYSQEELDAAVAAAIQPIQAALEDLKKSQEETEVDSRIATVKAELETKISELQAELDSAVLRAAEAEKTHSEFVAALDALKAEEDAAVEVARRKDERLVTVREVASFPDDYLEANADRWAELDVEAFDALINDWKAISSAKKDDTGGVIPKVTAMVASRNDDGNKSALAEVLEWNLRGIDPRTL